MAYDPLGGAANLPNDSAQTILRALHDAHYSRSPTREKAQMGVFMTLIQPTKRMLREAVSAEFNETPYGKYPRLQIITVE